MGDPPHVCQPGGHFAPLLSEKTHGPKKAEQERHENRRDYCRVMDDFARIHLDTTGGPHRFSNSTPHAVRCRKTSEYRIGLLRTSCIRTTRPKSSTGSRLFRAASDQRWKKAGYLGERAYRSARNIQGRPFEYDGKPQ